MCTIASRTLKWPSPRTRCSPMHSTLLQGHVQGVNGSLCLEKKIQKYKRFGCNSFIFSNKNESLKSRASWLMNCLNYWVCYSLIDWLVHLNLPDWLIEWLTDILRDYQSICFLLNHLYWFTSVSRRLSFCLKWPIQGWRVMTSVKNPLLK